MVKSVTILRADGLLINVPGNRALAIGALQLLYFVYRAVLLLQDAVINSQLKGLGFPSGLLRKPRLRHAGVVNSCRAQYAIMMAANTRTLCTKLLFHNLWRLINGLWRLYY